MGGTSMKDVGGAVLAGCSPPFLGRERAAVDVDVGPERRSPRYRFYSLPKAAARDDANLIPRPRHGVHSDIKHA